jgi:hypothetical protein
VATDISAWADAIRPIAVPAAHQTAKATILNGLDLMSKASPKWPTACTTRT